MMIREDIDCFQSLKETFRSWFNIVVVVVVVVVVVDDDDVDDDDDDD